MIPFEEANLESFRMLLRIEICVRELLSAQLASELGRAWVKRLPAPMLTQIREAQRTEAGRQNYSFLRLGPLYYLTLGEVAAVLKMQLGRSLLEEIGDLSLADRLEQLLPVRNAICHCRSTGEAGHLAVRSAYEMLRSAVGDRMDELCATPSAGVWPEDARLQIIDWLRELKRVVAALEPGAPAISEAIPDLLDQFWLDSPEALGVTGSDLRRLESAVAEYNGQIGVGATARRHGVREESRIAELCDSMLRILTDA